MLSLADTLGHKGWGKGGATVGQGWGNTGAKQERSRSGKTAVLRGVGLSQLQRCDAHG